MLDRYKSLGVQPEIRRFDSDIDIANAWKRLEMGSHLKKDLELLKHEMAEAWYMKKHGPSYSEAHNAADKRYPTPDFAQSIAANNSSKPGAKK